MGKQIKRKLAWVIGGLLVSYLTGCLLLRWGQTRLMFFPDPTLKATPDMAGLAYENVWLPMSEGTVHGWWIPASENAPVVLYLHGNGSNLGDLVTRAKRLHQLGIALLLIDYRGYGRSQGPFPSETSVYADAEAAWQYLTQTRQIAPETIVLYGQSIGGAVAIELAARHPEAAGVIAESTFTSMRDMVTRSVPASLLPIDWLLTQQFDSLSKVRSLQVPILLIHGTADETIPATMSQHLFTAAPTPKHLLLIPDADHDNVAHLGGKKYFQVIKQFVEQGTRRTLATVQKQSTGSSSSASYRDCC